MQPHSSVPGLSKSTKFFPFPNICLATRSNRLSANVVRRWRGLFFQKKATIFAYLLPCNVVSIFVAVVPCTQLMPLVGKTQAKSVSAALLGSFRSIKACTSLRWTLGALFLHSIYGIIDTSHIYTWKRAVRGQKFFQNFRETKYNLNCVRFSNCNISKWTTTFNTTTTTTITTSTTNCNNINSLIIITQMLLCFF